MDGVYRDRDIGTWNMGRGNMVTGVWAWGDGVYRDGYIGIWVQGNIGTRLWGHVDMGTGI